MHCLLRLRIVWATAFLLTLGSTASAQDDDWAVKLFEKTKHDFGQVAKSSKVSYQFKMKNIYKQTVHISNVRTTCGCSVGRPSTNTLKSLEEGYVEVSLDTERFSRRKDSNLIITFDAPKHAEVRIPLTAYIRTDVVLSPGDVNFGAVDVGSEAHRKVSIAYAGRNDWKIADLVLSNPYLSAHLVQRERSGSRISYDLDVALKPSAPVGIIRDRLYLVTNDASSPRVPVLIEARVEADITVTPPIVALGTLVPGKSKTVNVVLRGKKPFKVDRIECESDRGAFKVSLPNTTSPVHVLPLTVVPPETPGRFDEEFTVTVQDREIPLTFKAIGTITQVASSQGAE